MKTSNAGGRCPECNTWASRLYIVPADERATDGKPLFRYVCGPCWHGCHDPFDDGGDDG